MKNLSFKQRIVYLWDYYRYHALIVIFCIVFFCYFLSPLLATKKHDLLSIAIIDSTQTAKKTVRLCPTILPPYLAVTQSMMLFI